MSDAKENGATPILDAIAAARRAQTRQLALIRGLLATLVTKAEFDEALKALAAALDAIDEDHAAVAAQHTQYLQQLLRRDP